MIPSSHILRVATSFLVVATLACDSAISLRIDGTVTSAATGEPVPGALVSLSVSTGMFSSRVVASTRTDAAGRYSIRNTGEIEDCSSPNLYVEADGFESANSTVLGVGLQPEGTFQAVPTCDGGVQTIDVRLTPEEG